MNIQHSTLGLAVLAMTISTAVFADDIYKWIDADGNVHYEDRPSGEPSEVVLQFSYNRTNNGALQRRVQSQDDAYSARREARAAADAERQLAAANRAAAEEKLADCEGYRAKLKSMLEARRVYREDDEGERVYLDDNERDNARARVEKLVKETCSN